MNIFGSLIFAGMSGSALADIGGLGRIEIDAMRNKGFKAPFAAAVTSSSAIVGPIFPPSIPLIIYGTVTGVSVIQLLLGGILPGILCVIMLMAMTGWLALRRNYPRTERWPTGAELWRDFKPALPAIMAPVILIAGMLMGFFTPTEIASVTVLYALLISSLFYRELTWQGILDASYETIRSSSGILLIVAVAALFGWILSVEGVPQKLTALMLQISTNPYVLLFIVNILLLLVGMFLDSTTAILVIAPIIAKPLVAAGVDPVHLGMVVVFNLMIGLLTPPMGLALFLVADIAQGDDEGSAEGDAAVLRPAGHHAAAHHLRSRRSRPGFRAWRSAVPEEIEMKKPVIALAMGDPAGISPELTAKVVALDEVRDAARVVVIGDRRVFDEGAKIAGVELPMSSFRI